MRQTNHRSSTVSSAYQSFSMANHGQPLLDGLSHSGYGGTSVSILETPYLTRYGLSRDNSVGPGPVRLPSSSREEDWRRQEDGQRSFDERETRKQLEKEEDQSGMEVEGSDYGTDETSPRH